MFLVDSNILINAHLRWYRFENCPGFWNILKYASDAHIAASVEPVFDELKAKNDWLSNWCEVRRNNGFFKSINQLEVQEAFQQLAIYVDHSPYFNQRSRNKFYNGADGWLVAYAMTHACIVVTQETLVDRTSQEIKIPNLCLLNDVELVNASEFLSSLPHILIDSDREQEVSE